MFRTSTFFILLLISATVAAANDDLQELKQLSEAAESQGLESLLGLTCHGVAEALASNGHSTWRHHVRGSFRSADRLIVFIGDKPDDWIGAAAKNGRLVYSVNGPSSGQAKMPSYEFGAASHKSKLRIAGSFFPPLVSGGYLADVPFIEAVKQKNFSATRLTAEDSPEYGRCWSWSIGTESKLFPYVGKVWFRSFENGASAIGKIEYSLPNGRTNRVVNEFSKNPAYPSLIEKVVTQEGESSRTFVISKIEPENEPPDGYAPERFGLTTPTDPLTTRIWMIVAAIGVGAIATYLTLRYRRNR